MGITRAVVGPIFGFVAAYSVTMSNMRSGDAHDAAHREEMPPSRVIQNVQKMVFEENRANEAIDLYLAKDFISHGDSVNSAKAVSQYLSNMSLKDVKLVLSQNEHVMLHHNSGGKDAVILFKVKDGHIVEIWNIK